MVDVHLDVVSRVADSACDVLVDIEAFKAAVRTVGRLMRPEALVLIETTVPIGTCEKVVLRILREERARRGISASLLLAHAYERVMPGPSYVDSIRAFGGRLRVSTESRQPRPRTSSRALSTRPPRRHGNSTTRSAVSLESYSRTPIAQ